MRNWIMSLPAKLLLCEFDLEEYGKVNGMSGDKADDYVAIVTGKQIGRASCRERVLRLV